MHIDAQALESAKREALARIHTSREALVTQLDTARALVEAAAIHAAAGDLTEARVDLAQASDELYAAVETDEPVRALAALLGCPHRPAPVGRAPDAETASTMRDALGSMLTEAEAHAAKASELASAIRELGRGLGVSS